MRAAIAGYEGFFEVDSDGSVYSLERWVRTRGGRLQFVPHRKRVLSKHGTGYLTVRLSRAGVTKTYRVHRLVALAFVPNPLGLPDVNHRNTNKHCNEHTNLEWCDGFGNMQHASENELVAKGDRNGATKIFSASVPGLLLRYARGELLRDIAADLGVGRNTVSGILSRTYGDLWQATLSEKRTRAVFVKLGYDIPTSMVVSGRS